MLKDHEVKIGIVDNLFCVDKQLKEMKLSECDRCLGTYLCAWIGASVSQGP